MYMCGICTACKRLTRNLNPYCRMPVQISFFLVFHTGNAVLLVIFAVIGHDNNKSSRGNLALYNILQIIFSIEFVLCVPGILWYLGM